MRTKNTPKRDLRIELLRALQENPARSNKELASALGIDASSLGRLKYRCEQDGSIKGYKAILNPKAFAKSTLAFVQLALLKTDAVNVESTIQFLMEQSEVQEVHSIQGEYDLFVKLRVESNADVLAFNMKKAIPKHNVRDTSTMIVFDTYKETTDIRI